MTEMRKCKECGKLFTPKGREKYCSGTHYRPCPVCGKLVEAKYLSDPARRCEDCKKGNKKVVPSSPIKLVDNLMNSVEPFNNSESDSSKISQPILIGDTIVRKYVGVRCKDNFIPGHTYLIRVAHDGYAYVITSNQDLTDEDNSKKCYMRFSSQISINQNFEAV